jgi:RNA polymerase sigma-70 factor (ECF subfamily)
MAQDREEQRDQSLVARCRDGDADAFAQLYAIHGQQVFRYAYRLLGSRDDADDAKQETFVRAYQSMRGFRGGCSVATWLRRICCNLCRDRIKARTRRREAALGPAENYAATVGGQPYYDPHSEAEDRLTRQHLRQALDALPHGHRNLLVLRELEELSYEEISHVLGCTVASVKLRLFRARRQLRARFHALQGSIGE